MSISDHGIRLDEPISDHEEDPIASFADRRTERQFRNMERALRRDTPRFRSVQNDPCDRPQNTASSVLPIDTPTPTPQQPQIKSSSNQPLRPSDVGGQLIAWFCLLCGLLAFGAGIGVLVWSMTNNRGDVWNLGLGLTLGGQGILILGLVLVLLRLWRASRFSAMKLQQVQAQLVAVHRSAEVALAARNSGAPAFYAELARGASPQVMLSNLRGQVDQLAARFAA